MIARLHGLALLTTLLVFSLVTVDASAQSVTAPTFRVIDRVQKLMTQDKPAEAIEQLEKLFIKTKNNPYDHAITCQYLAHNSVMMDDVPRARSALESALVAEDKLPDEMLAELKLLYGQIVLRDDEFELAAKVFDEWLAVAEETTAPQLFNAGYANYMSKNLPRAEELLSACLDKSRSNALDSWYQTYYRALFDQGKYERAEQLLFELIDRDESKPVHWRLLASHYLQLEQNNDALAAIMVSYLQNQVTLESDLKQIVTLFDFVDAPERAARLLEKWIAEGKIEPTAESTRQLGNLWLIARENDKAKESLLVAAREAPDGKTFALLGGIYFESEEWVDAYKAYNRALDLGGLEAPNRISMLSGISAYWAGNMEEARKALVVAAESDEYRGQAETLIRKIDET